MKPKQIKKCQRVLKRWKPTTIICMYGDILNVVNYSDHFVIGDRTHYEHKARYGRRKK